IKHFHGLREPERHQPAQPLVDEPASRSQITLPANLAANDIVSYVMQPGDVLFNHVVTPHWVEAGDDGAAMSINLSHGGLRCNGKLNRRGELLEARFAQKPGERMVKGY